jgi:hypothetical protein
MESRSVLSTARVLAYELDRISACSGEFVDAAEFEYNSGQPTAGNMVAGSSLVLSSGDDT